MSGKFSIKGYFRKIRRDERERKAFLIGVAVFLIVFAGLMIYGHEAGQRQGDVVLTDGRADSAQGAVDTADASGDSAGAADADGNSAGAAGAGSVDAGGNSADVADGAASDGSGQGAVDTGPKAIFVDVGGAVNISGLFALPAGSRVADAIDAAGGLTDDADVKYLNRAAVLYDGDRLYVPTDAEVRNGTAPPSAGQVSPSGGYTGEGAGTSSSGAGAAGQTAPAAPLASSLININTAASEELQKLNGVGPVTAQKIIDYRTKRGGFKTIEELMNVSGIGAKTFEKLKDYITV